MAASWEAVQGMLGKIWTRLEVIDKLAEAQGKLCQRLDELEKALGRLDPNASAVAVRPITKTAKLKVGASAAKGDAKTPALTTVYDPSTKGITPKSPRPPTWPCTTPRSSQSNSCLRSTTWKAPTTPRTSKLGLICPSGSRQPKPVPEYTSVYDPVTQEPKLMLWSKYISQNKAPSTDWAMKYNPSKQGIDLVFWRNYQPGGGYKVLSVSDFF